MFRWALVLPAAIGIAFAGWLAGALTDLLFYRQPAGLGIAAGVVRGIGLGLAVYLGARIAPLGGHWVAALLAMAAATLEWIPLVYGDAPAPGSRAVASKALASAIAALFAWAYWRRRPGGFRSRWSWAALGLLGAAGVAILVAGKGPPTVRFKPARAASASWRLYRGDGIAFRHPSDWILTVGPWKEHKNGRTRWLHLNREGGESVKIFQIRPAVDLPVAELSELTWSELISSGKPISQPRRVTVTIAGTAVGGIQRDLSVRYLGFHIPFRTAAFALRRKNETFLFYVIAAVEDWSSAEPRLKEFFEHVELD